MAIAAQRWAGEGPDGGPAGGVATRRRLGEVLVDSGVQPQPMKVLYNAGFVDKIGLDNVCANIDVALARSRIILQPPA